MERSVSIKEFIAVIKKLPEDPPKHTPGKWYRTQKEHWLGWLSQYLGPGAYNRKTRCDDAKVAYNRIQCPEMLLYLIDAAGLAPEVKLAAQEAAAAHTHHSKQVGAIRRCAPWEMVYEALFAERRSLNEGASKRGWRMIFRRVEHAPTE